MNYTSRLRKLEQKIHEGEPGIKKMIQAAGHYDMMRSLPEGSTDRLREERAWLALDPDRYCATVHRRIVATKPRTAENKRIMQMVDWSRDEVPGASREDL